jgi:signal transduction histidine kinase
MKSIRARLFISISGLIVFFVFFSWFLNTELLGRYYTAQKKSVLIESAKSIEEIYKNQAEDIDYQLERIARTSNINIEIVGSDFESRYSSAPRMFILRRPTPRMKVLEDILDDDPNSIVSGNYTIRIATDPRLSTNFLNLVTKLDKGDYMILSTPLAALKESADIANTFFLFTGILTILLGSVISFFFAKRFTKPILELNDITQKMSTLDFSTKYDVKTQDEIGGLGKNINSLSEQLEKSISELMESNEKLKEEIKKERQIDEMRKEFISSVSHELKTPIALIQGYSEGLKLNVNDDEENKNYYCDVIMDETTKMNKLVKQLLDLSQIESGYLHLEKTNFDISVMIEQVLKKNALIFNEKNINLVFEREGNIEVNADIDRIEQVLMNYINNAINHVDDKKNIRVTIKKENNKARIFVYNSGKNIPEESLQKIWTSFYKIDKARTRGYGGTGLGLSIVRAIQELHHNSFGVNNLEDGVEFWFEVDLASN